ncbi:type VI secretion system-associated protein TagF [Sphaerotilus microaerophilus]|uniref:Type VI secretion-associated protein n=1 Tax=Sphaerotilus microaerophilus TaxID=2914710 RepID=A0ABN6PIL5_9BURK|nr:type VI secretion system-associated protein TagF [Sphaerotilus sp. FB-5]BDI04876.1 type VI secretion-associated protein [Sphaerotilus sp. FB-5]
MSALPMLIDAPGWYGKLGALGDFATRRLPEAHVQACDRWLATVMDGSHAVLGERWLQAYLQAPLWRYAWAPGVAGAADEGLWWFGVLMPSCDAVGRYFPLLLAQSRRQPPQDRIALDHLELWWQQLGQAALLTLAEGATVEDFEAALADLAPWPTARSGASAAWAGLSLQRAPQASPWVPGASVSAQRLQWPARTGLGDGLAAMAAQALQAQLEGCSVWWPQTPAGTASPVTVLRGLPDGRAFAELMAPAA